MNEIYKTKRYRSFKEQFGRDTIAPGRTVTTFAGAVQLGVIGASCHLGCYALFVGVGHQKTAARHWV